MSASRCYTAERCAQKSVRYSWLATPRLQQPSPQSPRLSPSQHRYTMSMRVSLCAVKCGSLCPCLSLRSDCQAEECQLEASVTSERPTHPNAGCPFNIDMEPVRPINIVSLCPSLHVVMNASAELFSHLRTLVRRTVVWSIALTIITTA